MLKNTLIIALIILVIYLYYQNRQKPNLLGESKIDPSFQNFLQTNLNSNSLEELKSKLDSKTLDELLEQNEDYETEVDTLTRTKNSLEQDLTAQAEAFQSRLREKDREIRRIAELSKESEVQVKKLKEDLGSEKQQHKGSLGRITKLTEQINQLEKQLKKLPGEFPDETSSISSQNSTHQAQLENFIEWVKDYEEFEKVDWNYYRSQKDWQKSFRNWNKLRTDRISLLEKWKEENK